MPVKKILVTGANGFVGRHVVASLKNHAELDVIPATRKNTSEMYCNTQVISSESSQSQWEACLEGVNVIVHCAAHAHVLDENPEVDLGLYQKINVEMTGNLALAAVKKKVNRFIFISTAGVHGACSIAPFTETSEVNPHNNYTASKLKAEYILQDIASKYGLEVCIIRAPLIYGPGVGANFLTLITWQDKKIPLPFGAIDNSRSLLGVRNLVSFIEACLFHENASGQVFLLSDGEDTSTTQLLKKVSTALGHKSALLPVPLFIVKALLTACGKNALFHKLCDSLQIDSSKARRQLGWSPVCTFDTELKSTIEAYRKGQG